LGGWKGGTKRRSDFTTLVFSFMCPKAFTLASCKCVCVYIYIYDNIISVNVKRFWFRFPNTCSELGLGSGTDWNHVLKLGGN